MLAQKFFSWWLNNSKTPVKPFGQELDHQRCESFIFNEFLHESTINGIAKFQETKSRCCNFAWILAIVGSLLLVASLCTQGCLLYTSYKIKTSLKIEKQKFPLIFPAITFCSAFFLRSSFYKANPGWFDIYMAALSSTTSDTKTMLRKAKMSCKWTGPVADSSAEITDFFNGIHGLDFYRLVSFMSPDFNNMNIICWFQGTIRQCYPNPYFALTMTDLGPCITFNDINNISNQKEDHVQPFTVDGIGPENGLKLLIDVAQEDYCRVSDFYEGAGMLFSIKEPNSPFLSHYEKGFRHLSVGYEIDVVLKLIQFDRHTEHLKRCVSRPLIHKNGTNPIPYFRTFCAVKLIVLVAYEKCECSLPVPSRFLPYLNENNLGNKINGSFKVDCFSTIKLAICALSVVEKYFYSEGRQSLPDCPLPCIEQMFTLTFSMKRLIPRQLQSMKIVDDRFKNKSLLGNYTTFESWVEKNLILVNFYYGIDDIEIYTDDQAFLFSDLIIYIANSLGLVFGMSFLSIFEVLYGLIRAVLNVMSKFWYDRTRI